jgi:hypothetical protein
MAARMSGVGALVVTPPHLVHPGACCNMLFSTQWAKGIRRSAATRAGAQATSWPNLRAKMYAAPCDALAV